MYGYWEGSAFILDEAFAYDAGYSETRRWRVAPHGITGVLDGDGTPLDVVTPHPERAIHERSASRMTELLEGVLTHGTARAAAELGFSGRAAGKTGSSDSLRDAWFVGYTRQLVVTVWVGYDDNHPVGLSGGAAALPIWTDLMRRIAGNEADLADRPRRMVRVKIDPATGMRATRHCPERREVQVARGAEPERCTVHAPRKRDLWGRRR